MIAASRASAADLPVRTGAPAYIPVAAPYNWGGGYIGINGGYAFAKATEAMRSIHRAILQAGTST
jgi:hypothetical protein